MLRCGPWWALKQGADHIQAARPQEQGLANALPDNDTDAALLLLVQISPKVNSMTTPTEPSSVF